MSECEYPTEEELEEIRNWGYADFDGMMEFVKSIWKYADCGYWKQKDGLYYISTGGWSGNEEIISAMADCKLLWTLYWCLSSRGGHYIFGRGDSWMEFQTKYVRIEF